MNATFRSFSWLTSAVVATLFVANTGLAQSRSESSYSEATPPRIDRPDTPFDNLANAERGAVNAQARLLQAMRDYKLSIAQLARTRKIVEETHRTSPEVLAAQKALQEAKVSLQQSMEPVMADLARIPAYQALVERRDALERQLADDATLVGPARNAVAQELLEVKRQMRNQEQAAIEFDVASNKAQEAVHAAEAEVREINQQTKADIDQDPQLVQAKSYFSGAKQNLSIAQQDFASQYVNWGLSERGYRRAAMTNAIIHEPNFWYGHYWWR